MSRQGSLSIERMCQLVPVSRAGFYRSLQEQRPVEEEMEVRSAIQQIAVEHRRRYGYRRISADLRRRGMLVNQEISDSAAADTEPASRCVQLMVGESKTGLAGSFSGQSSLSAAHAPLRCLTAHYRKTHQVLK